MKLLVLGGTRFVGRAVVEAGVARSWNVTAVSRGESGEPPAGVHWHRADRRDPVALAPLAAHHWDVVIDTWGEQASVVDAAAGQLADSAGWFGYVSSRSVYQWPLPPGSDESAPVVSPDSTFEYAANKRGGELAVQRHFQGRSLIARPGLILGPHEDTGRLTWWLERSAAGGSLVAPLPEDQCWQYVDVRDLAEFLLDSGERATTGIANVVCPAAAGVTTRRLVEACIEVTGSRATPVWVSPEILRRAGVKEWDDLPGWIAPDSEGVGLHDCDVSVAIAMGLTCRAVESTVMDTWAWLATLPPRGRRLRSATQPKRGLSAEQEQAIWWLAGA
jgi:2'-hydroxyisoflavone reductase